MPRFAYTSYQNTEARLILDQLSSIIFVLKINAQDKLSENGLTKADVTEKSYILIGLINNLIETVKSLFSETEEKKTLPHLGYLGLARQFIEVNAGSIEDRLDELERIQQLLRDLSGLSVRQFQLLDDLQLSLEAEVSEAFKDLFRL